MTDQKEGLATRLTMELDAWGHDVDCSRRRSRALARDFTVVQCDCNLESVMSAATPETCAALDADAEAMRIRRAVEESGRFRSLELSGPWHRDRGGHGAFVLLRNPTEACGGKDISDAYTSAYDALRKAGKL